MRLIWVDDDAKGLLSPLQYRFRRKGFGPIVPLHFYEDATDFFGSDTYFTKSAVLLDVILPSREGKVFSYLGIELTKELIERGMRRLAFLSVVFEEEITDDLKGLMAQCDKKGISLEYKFFDKTRIVDTALFGALADYLKSEG